MQANQKPRTKTTETVENDGAFNLTEIQADISQYTKEEKERRQKLKRGKE